MSGRPKRAGAGQAKKILPGETPEAETPVDKKPKRAAASASSPKSSRTEKKTKAPAKRASRAKARKTKDSDEDNTDAPWHKQLKKSDTTGASLAYIVLEVADTRRSADLYKQLFGFVQRSPDDPMTNDWLELDTGSTAMAFHRSVKGGPAATGAGNVGSTGSGWFVPDIQAFHERAVALNTTVIEVPTLQPSWGGTKARYADIDGIEFSVTEFNEEKIKELEKKKQIDESAIDSAHIKAAASHDDDTTATAATTNTDDKDTDKDDDNDSSKKSAGKRGRPKASSKAKSKSKAKTRAAPKKKKAKTSDHDDEDDESAEDNKAESEGTAADTSE